MLRRFPYAYRAVPRVTNPDGTRYYVDPDTGERMASVTTILSATADRTALDAWRMRVGEERAERERRQATGLGSLMHLHLENAINETARPTGNNTVRLLAARMADRIIEHAFPHIDEVWGIETPLYMSGLYAGTTDLVGVYRGAPAIIDYKTTKRMKKRAQIGDYMAQGCAYALAHNLLFDTRIATVVVLMVSRAAEFQSFVLDGEDFHAMCARWQDRVVEYVTRLPAAVAPS